MTDITSETLKGLLEKATPGPWKQAAVSHNDKMALVGSNFDDTVEETKNGGMWVAQCIGPDRDGNSDLIALTPTLATEVLSSRKRIAELEGEIARVELEWVLDKAPPRDCTLLVTVEPTEANSTYYGNPKWPQVFAAYVDEEGRYCDAGTWHPDTAIQGNSWRVVAWALMPKPFVHFSDCAANNAPALPVGPCDCRSLKDATP